MKLRNKKTGEIIEKYPDRFVVNSGEQIRQYDSLAELNEEWEDYEEPKEYWFLSGRGEIRCVEDDDTKFDRDHKQIGNYFETKEEAEKAAERLRAWKRLKDKGFRFEGYDNISSISRWRFELVDSSEYEVQKDLDLLFGGEE